MKNLKAGDYFIFYRPDFKPEHTVKRLNLVFYSKFDESKSPEERAKLKAV